MQKNPIFEAFKKTDEILSSANEKELEKLFQKMTRDIEKYLLLKAHKEKLNSRKYLYPKYLGLRNKSITVYKKVKLAQ